jgi:hypothetical protein
MRYPQYALIVNPTHNRPSGSGMAKEICTFNAPDDFSGQQENKREG